MVVAFGMVPDKLAKREHWEDAIWKLSVNVKKEKRLTHTTPHTLFPWTPPFPMVYIRGVVEGVVEGLAFKVEATLSLFFVFLPLVTPCMIIQYIHMDSYSVWGKL